MKKETPMTLDKLEVHRTNLRTDHMHFIEIGQGSKPTIVFAHGWARNHRDFIPAAEALMAQRKSLLIDLPGHGETPRPETTWTNLDHANFIAAFLRVTVGQPIVWVGHSHGGRIGLTLAAHHPDLLKGLILVAAAGIHMPRPWNKRMVTRFRQSEFRLRRHFAKTDAEIVALEKRFGSADYVASRETGMRDIFLAAVREDQSASIKQITTPTIVLSAANDTDTPPAMGQRMAQLIPNARFLLLPEFDHISVLHRGHHIIALRAKELSGV